MVRPDTRRALLLVDVVDSTAVSERLGDAAAAELWSRHDRAARDLLPGHRGREIDRTDGFLFLFESPADAVAYALAYHAALRPLGLSARAGLHVGPVILRENSATDIALGAKPLEVEGLAKPIAARVMGLASPGQTLLTADARDALGDTTHRVQSHGHWRLKGVAEPMELFEVGDATGPFVPPSDAAKVYRVVRQGELWLPAREVPRRLPAERDAFVGREHDLLELARRLDDGARLVSVLGIGGTGKTRLVTRYGWTWLGEWPGGVWFCDLSEARSVDGILSAVARSLDIPLEAAAPVAQLGHAIAARGRCLLLFDNFEQVTRHASETLGAWLDRAPDARFVVTTREILGLSGESALTLSPLVHDDALALFVARAQAASRDFRPAEDADALSELVELLDRLPLALELAAARARLMSPRTMLSRMGERFKLLSSSGGRRDRQATLRATLDWSWDLLGEGEQAGLAQLSVFEGGFTLAAAEAVLSVGDSWPTDVVQALVDRSLVSRVGDARFDLLVSVQEYAVERLFQRGETAATEARHCAYFATFGTPAALNALASSGGAARGTALLEERDNLVAAVRRATERRAAEEALQALAALNEIGTRTGSARLGLELAESVLAGTTVQALRAEARLRAGRFALAAGQPDSARAHLEGALETFRAIGAAHREPAALGDLSVMYFQLGHAEESRAAAEAALAAYVARGNRIEQGVQLVRLAMACRRLGRVSEAREHYEEALALTRALGDQKLEGIVLGNLALLHKEQGRFDEALALSEQALQLHRSTGNRFSEAAVWVNVAAVLIERGRRTEARAHFESALAAFRAMGHRRLEGHVLGNLGKLELVEGRAASAAVHFDQALQVHREVGNRAMEGSILSALGALAVSQGELDLAEARLQAALSLHRDLGDARQAGIALRELAAIALSRHRDADARSLLDAAERSLRAVGDVLELGLALCVRAGLLAQDDPEAARSALAEAEGCAEQLGVAPGSGLAGALARARAALATV